MPVSSENPDADIFDMVARGERVYAVAAYRARYHVSLADAEAAVAAMVAIVADAGRPAPAPGAPGTLEADPEIVEAIGRGHLIDAIRVYRARTGVGLGDAKAAVEAMIARGVGQRPPAPPPPGAPTSLGEAQARIDAMIHARNLIAAIKLYREVTGASLRDAKAAVEDRAAALRG